MRVSLTILLQSVYLLEVGADSMRWLVMPFLRYADFKGRSDRTEFWTFFGLSVAALILTEIGRAHV